METDAQPAADPPKDRKTYNGIEHFPNMQMGLAHYRTLDAGIGRWLQVDPEAELFYSMSPYCSMGNNPILYDDPNGDAIPIIFFAGAAIIGGGQNIYANWDKIVENPWSALGYGLSGAAGGAVSVVNPVLGGTIAAGGNIITDAATGNIPDFNNFQDVLGYTAGNALDGLAVGGAGSIAKSGLNGLKHLGLDLTPDLALGAIDNASSLAYDLGFDIARDKSGEWIIDKATEEFLTLATGSPVSVIAKAPNHYLRSFRSIGATVSSRNGAAKIWDINGPNTTAKWQAKDGRTYSQFGSDGTVWSKSTSNHADYFKVYDKKNNHLIWKRDADRYGNYIDPSKKHKGSKGRIINLKALKKIF